MTGRKHRPPLGTVIEMAEAVADEWKAQTAATAGTIALTPSKLDALARAVDDHRSLQRFHGLEKRDEPAEPEPGPPLFDGEPEHCSLCGEPGHTHDDHWLFQHEPVQALVKRIGELEKNLKSAYQMIDGFRARAHEAEQVIRDAAELFERPDIDPRWSKRVAAWLARPEVVKAREE